MAENEPPERPKKISPKRRRPTPLFPPFPGLTPPQTPARGQTATFPRALLEEDLPRRHAEEDALDAAAQRDRLLLRDLGGQAPREAHELRGLVEPGEPRFAVSGTPVS